MSTRIFYYTGTGNSLWTARQLAQQLDTAEVISMTGTKKEANNTRADIVGFVFPVHIWGVPKLALEFIRDMKKYPDTYYFAAAVNGGQVSRTLIQLKELMKSWGFDLSSGFSIEMPSNYIPWGGPGSEDEMKRLNEKAVIKIKNAAVVISKKEHKNVEKGPLWQRLVFTRIYDMSYKHTQKMDKDFWADEKCNSCGVCLKVCPAKNIMLKSGKPQWNHKCFQCFACLQWCPKQAVQYGKKTAQYPRYHHPEVTPGDMLDSLK